MSGAGGFRAAIEEQKRVARERDEERKRSVSQHSSMPVSPTTGPYDAPTTSSTLDTLGFGFDWGREPDVLESTSNVPVKNEDDASRKVLTTSDAVRNPPVGNNFAGLTSARKRSRVGKDLEENMKPAPALKSPMEETEEDEEDDDEKPAGKRPFAPAKKISNRATRQAPEEM
ncbi:MAG: hypothetical protein M1823_004774 [Watsoniomyces obsoletus]|nr:MAG: hypothetical protein M1823_004774 [Watsoniomyces obsoletus]